MRTFTAVLAGKLIRSFVRKLKLSGGSAAPGLYALKIDPSLVQKLSLNIPKNIIITGTNGKTTTARMLAHIAKTSNLKVIRNHTGSNLERGIASTLISASRISNGNFNYDLGIWELDEAAFNSVAPKLNPAMVVFLNIFRDQLDRYGEVDTIVKRWCETLKKLSPETIILVNGDDANTLKLKEAFKGRVKTFGVEGSKIAGEGIGKKRRYKPDFEAKKVKTKGLLGSSFLLPTNNKLLSVNLPIPGIYHIYDATAAIACASNLNISAAKIISSLLNYQPAFGRVEKLPFGYIFLIKNPAGATQVFETIAPQIKPADRLLFALNDNLADGTDVSWIWDGEFEKLKIDADYSVKDQKTRGRGELKIVCSGTRAYDMAVRLKYAGFNINQIKVEENLKKALKEAQKGLKGQLFILPTYTAMLDLQRILVKSDIKKNYWEEE